MFGILEGFGAFAGWQTAALKAHRKSLLWPWPWGACWGSCLRVKVWRVWTFWRVLKGLESFGAFAGWQTAALKAHRKPLLWPGPGVPVGEVALALGCLLGKVFGILEGFGAFAGWQRAALKAHRKSLLWPWPWGACWGSCLRVKVWRVWTVWRVLEGLESFGAFAGWQTAALKAHRKPLLWPWPWGACLRSGLGLGVPAGDGVWRVWRVLAGFGGFGGFGEFWRVWSVCGLANGSFESP